MKKGKQEGRRTRLYVYGCSLGAQIIGLYLRKEGEKACDVVDGAVFYGTPWSPVQTSDFFYNNMFGFYQLVIGSNLSKETYRILPQLRPYLSEEDYNYYDRLLANNRAGMLVFDEKIYPHMYDY